MFKLYVQTLNMHEKHGMKNTALNKEEKSPTIYSLIFLARLNIRENRPSQLLLRDILLIASFGLILFTRSFA